MIASTTVKATAAIGTPQVFTALAMRFAARQSAGIGDYMDRSLMVVAMIAAWMLWQEVEYLDHPGSPSWHLEGRFSGESACHEARQIRFIEQLLRADSGGPTILNQPSLEQGIIWVEWPDGLRAKMRFVCLPETIDPEERWFGQRTLAPSLRPAARF
jgi:hypothetical protein